MSGALQAMAPLRGGLVPMPAVPQGGVCKLCHSSAHMGSQECGPCSSAALLDPPEVLPITMVERSGMLHDHLRRYKDDQSPSVSRRFARRLGALTAVFLRYHTACLGSWDVVTPIPSPDRSAPGSIIEWVGALKERRIDLLVGTEKVQHGSPEPASFTVAPEAEGKRVLLFDDMFTSGATMYSAAAAIRSAGATVVGPLVVGRYIDPGWEPSKKLFGWLKDIVWDETQCCRCQGVLSPDASLI